MSDDRASRAPGPAAAAPGASASRPASAGAAGAAALEGPCEAACDAARAGLYVHVPFCVRRCRYCDFASGLVSERGVERWLAALEREASLWSDAAPGELGSVFLGGGTPSVLRPASVERGFAALRRRFVLAPDAEITLEANPESVDEARLAAWRAAGVNRLSIGAQSLDDGELARLGRIHDAAAVERAVARARAAGFERLSLDLLFGFPGHTAESWERTLDRALGLGIGHLSAYALIPERDTPLGEAIRRGELAVRDDDAQARAYERLTDRAAEAGLGCYETSNFCRPGEECRHNLVYWLHRPHLGLGPSAHGLWRGRRFANPRWLGAWARALEDSAPDPWRRGESLDPVTEAREIVMLGLRLARGLDLERHEDEDASGRPGPRRALYAHYGRALDEAVATGRLVRTGRRYAVPRALRFLADDVIAWIDARAGAHATARRPGTEPSAAPPGPAGLTGPPRTP